MLCDSQKPDFVTLLTDFVVKFSASAPCHFAAFYFNLKLKMLKSYCNKRDRQHVLIFLIYIFHSQWKKRVWKFSTHFTCGKFLLPLKYDILSWQNYFPISVLILLWYWMQVNKFIRECSLWIRYEPCNFWGCLHIIIFLRSIKWDLKINLERLLEDV